jgi:hypothetical protein
MLVIKEKQIEVFRTQARRAFEQEMLEHLLGFSPNLSDMAGLEALRKTIGLGIDLAESHGFTFRGPVRLYLELMMLFGSYFDTDPQYPWAAEILADRGAGGQMRRAEILYEKASDCWRQLAGPDNAHLKDALRRLSQFAHEPLMLSQENYIPALIQETSRLYPQKAACVGAQGLEAVIRKAIAGAQMQRFTQIRGVTLVAGLMLSLGYGCGADPCHSWISQTLADPSIPDPVTRCQRLEQQALAWLERVLRNLERGESA